MAQEEYRRRTAEVRRQRDAKAATPECKIAKLKIQACQYEIEIRRAQFHLDRERDVAARSGIVDAYAMRNAGQALVNGESWRDSLLSQLRDDHDVAFSTARCGDRLRVPADLIEAKGDACDVADADVPPGIVTVPMGAGGKRMPLNLPPDRRGGP